MKNFSATPWKNPVWILGIVFIAASLLIFLFPHFMDTEDEFLGIIVGNYGIAMVYLIILFSHGVFRFQKNSFLHLYECLALFLILALLSAFSLNRQINIFHHSTLWLQAMLVFMCLGLTAIAFRNKHLPLFDHVLFFLLGASLLLCLYFALYLSPYYPIGLIGIPLLGLSLHLFVPLWFVIFIVSYLLSAVKKEKSLFRSFVSGFLLPMLFVLMFALRWNSIQEKIRFSYNNIQTDYNNILPAWIRVSQSLSSGWITERAVKSNLMYVTHHPSSSFFRAPGMNSFEEVKEHDPLVMIASVFSNSADMNEQDKIKIVESMYDARHLGQERLWRGTFLETDNVITDVMLYPELRIAYTEKIIEVRNTEKRTGNERPQEAIYTFHLPEGGVATSLSLWIHGKEEKGMLTAKAKADSAYKTIVGVEARDPSLVHWQEGNTITVRVFPCTPDENRKFKVGFTAPLTSDGNKVWYENILLEGPSMTSATETVLLRFVKKSPPVRLPDGFVPRDVKSHVRHGGYREEWLVEMQQPPLRANAFSFQGTTYSILEYRKKYAPFTPEAIYLDLNASWTKEEYEEVLALSEGKEVYALIDQLPVHILPANKEEVFQLVKELNFTLFPFFSIKGPKSLVISKSPSRSPNLNDLKNSEFIKKLFDFLAKKQEIHFFQLNSTPSPYVNSLKAFRALNYDAGNLEQLAAVLGKHQFAASQEEENMVSIPCAAINLKKERGVSASNAPDHLMRLYAYNDILRRIREDYFTGNFVQDALVAEAREANIVTPVSSLVVLETVEDYKRFTIETSNEGLENASMKSAGAVPEPHEWMLLLLSLATIAYIVLQKIKTRSNACSN